MISSQATTTIIYPVQSHKWVWGVGCIQTLPLPLWGGEVVSNRPSTFHNMVWKKCKSKKLWWKYWRKKSTYNKNIRARQSKRHKLVRNYSTSQAMMTSSQACSPNTEFNTIITYSVFVVLVQSTSDYWWDTYCTRYEIRITGRVITMARKNLSPACQKLEIQVVGIFIYEYIGITI